MIQGQIAESLVCPLGLIFDSVADSFFSLWIVSNRLGLKDFEDLLGLDFFGLNGLKSTGLNSSIGEKLRFFMADFRISIWDPFEIEVLSDFDAFEIEVGLDCGLFGFEFDLFETKVELDCAIFGLEFDPFDTEDGLDFAILGLEFDPFETEVGLDWALFSLVAGIFLFCILGDFDTLAFLDTLFFFG